MTTIEQLTQAAQQLTPEQIQDRLERIDHEARLLRAILRASLRGKRTGTQSPQRTLLPPGEAAKVVNLSVSQLLIRANRGELPSVRLPGGDVRYDLADLTAWLERQQTTEGQS